ncbi:uncharacterized protein TNCV_3535491 [Trichonephila clavipes]|nr:uncharacterized protein TNCV_3535491 [Trichonephila clavipes]
MFTNDPEEYRALIHFLKSDKEFEFYVIDRKKIKPIKAVLKGLPSSSKINEITNDLAEVKVEGYLVRGITKCFNCNNFYHTAANCFMKPRCLKCGKEHATKNCHLKERQLNPFCINCQDFGHSACYTKCPKFPQPKNGTAFSDRTKKKSFSSKWTKEGISFANVVSGEISSQSLPENENKKEDSPRGFLSQDSNISNLAQVLELFNIISILKFSTFSQNLKQQAPTKKKPSYWQKR